MTTVVTENIDKLTYPNLPPIITTDSQGTYHKNTSLVTKVLAAIRLWSQDEIDHAWQKIYEVSGGWVTGCGNGTTLQAFASAMEVDIWDKPVWDYSSDIYYVSRLGDVYGIRHGNDEDCYSTQGWVWKKLESEKGWVWYSGSGASWLKRALRKNTPTEEAIRYISKYDPFTNDIIQCNIDLKEELNRRTL